MKRLLLFIVIIGLFHFAEAQVKSPVMTGSVTGRKELADKSVTFNVGSAIPYFYKDTARYTYKDILLQVGFPYNALYLDKTFPGGLFVSKGYYANYIQLKWEVVNNIDKLDHFEVYRKKLGEKDSVWVNNLSKESRKWEDMQSEANEVYQYTLHAVGIPGAQIEGMTYISGIGFRSPLATVTGRITYTGGTGVLGASVVATTEDDVPSKSIQFGGESYISVPQYGELKLDSFTFQAYLKFDGANSMGIFQKGNYKITYENGNFRFYSGDQFVEYNFPVKNSAFVHLSCVFKDGVAKIYIPGIYVDVEVISHDTLYSATANISASANSSAPILLGKTDALSYTGNMDEIRLWQRALPPAEILRDFNRYLSGKEPGMAAYWRMNEGFGQSVYDLSKTGSSFNENHGYFMGNNVAWSEQTPTTEQLGYKGVTDVQGNYIISGIPFLTDGSAYKFTPMLAPHNFQPDYKILFVSEDANVHNNIDFIDLASVNVSLNVVYNTGTKYPVADVLVKLDGNFMSDANNNLVKTKEDGTVDFRVPIGNHYLSFEKNGHTFENPDFPPRDSQGNIVRHLFDRQIPLLTVIDTTRVVLAGRIVGGPVEAAKTLGSKTNSSKNNIGVVKVELITEKGYDINEVDNPKTVNFQSDPETGEFSIKLLPEKYKPASATAVGNTKYVFNTDDDLALIDLSNQFFTKVETDSIFIKNNLGKMEFSKLDTVSTYNLRKDWTYRSNPTIEVQNNSGEKIISEIEYIVDNNGEKDTIPLAVKEPDGTITYPFGFPIFLFAKTYPIKITAFEQYVNSDSGNDIFDRVPVVDGIILINNDLALTDKQRELNLNKYGEVSYSFLADFPKIAEPYTKKMNVTLKTKTTNVQVPTLEAYILGGCPTGNNFVTKGPDKVDFILRDPPGSGSSATLEKGFASYTTKNSTVTNGEEGEEQFALQLGVRYSMDVGTPFFSVETEIETDNFIGVTFEHSFSDKNEMETKQTTTFEESFSTSADPSFVGANGDVFIGHSTNIVYGISKMMEIMPKANVPSYSETISIYGNYAISIENGLRVNPEFNTQFIYSQQIIKEEMIPHLEYLRNIIFEKVYYTKVFTDIRDPRYASNNDDKDIWTTEATTNPYEGKSYIFSPPDYTVCDTCFTDSVRLYNQQIANWKKILALNEKQKLEAKPDKEHKNISFGAGSSYTSSISSEYDSIHTDSWEFSIAPGVAGSLGFTLNKFGFRADLKEKYTHSESGSSGSGTTETQKVAFTLEDGDAENYLTVDVKKCQSGNGPVFVARGGQTSCPYEGAELTQYYEPGNHTLSFATVQIDGPLLACANPVSPRVPETEPAYFTMELSNVSDAEKDGWYIIGVDVASNPNGAKVMMDGATINSGVAVFVPYGKTVIKTLEVLKGRPDVDDYENIAVYLRSQCEESINSKVNISAYYASACSKIEFVQPSNNWVINVDNRDTMLIVASGYNLQHFGFEDFHLQYKPSGSSLWTTVQVFSNDPDKKDQPNTTYINNATTIQYLWDMRSLMDRAYDIRLVTHCDDGSTNYSETLTGMLDGQRPQVFGTPQPADGILDVDENISVQFNETIEKGLLIPGNFNVNGTLNTSDSLKHNAYLRYNGISDFAVIPEGISFNKKSFSIEFWVQTNQIGNQILFSQGNDPSNNIEIGLTEKKEIYFKFGSSKKIPKAALQYTETVTENAWQHLGFVYDSESGFASVYQNDKILFEEIVDTDVVTQGKIYIAKSASSIEGNFNGSMHELRIWSKVLDFGDFYANQYKMLSGNEIGLYGYWPMNDAFGKLAIDKSANRHMEIFANWEVDPGGWAWDFKTGSAVQIGTGYFAVIPEMDYTLEFWFKSEMPIDTVCFFSNQKGDGKEGENLKNKAMSICGLPNGKIVILSKGNIFEATSKNYFDNQWHHFALVVRRRGNVISLVDGSLQNEKENSFVGGLAGANMWLGSQVWSNISGTGNRFKYAGKLDEFRIWDLARTQTQIRLDMNSKLSGSETGLKVYVPFENYFKISGGITELLETKLYYPTDSLIFTGTDGFTKEAPNVKNVRSKQDIAFDFVASDDKIIINPKEFLLPQLEKNIIEITVQGVEDKYANRLASPVTWTAYVHRNQIRWEDERRAFTKEIYKPMEFVSSIKNTGGQQIGFTISNLPVWLKATPSSGVMNPESTREIIFTVNPAINIGEYNYDIILRTDNGFDEKLPLTVRVYKKPPNWNVDPSKFEATMNIVGVVKIEGILSTDIFDMVAVFKKGTDSIRGVNNVRYISDFDAYLVFLNVYGNGIGEELEFRLWDASAGHIIDDITPYNEIFKPNAVLGTTLDPVVFEAMNKFRQYIPLAKGWNWVSFNKLASNQNDLDSFLGTLKPQQNDQIKSHGVGFNNYDLTNGWKIGGIDSIDNRRMYQIKISNVDTIVYSGEKLVPENNPVTLTAGWNHIGYLPDLSMDINDALRLYVATNSEIIKSQFAFSMFDERVGWIGTLDFMQPGLGYMLKVNKAATLAYPNSTVFKGAKMPLNISPPLGWNSNYSEFEGNISVVARLDLSGFPELTVNSEMVLGSFIGKECRGFISPLSSSGIGYEPFFLTVGNSQNGQQVNFRLYDGAAGNTYSIEETVPFVADRVYGTTTEPMVLTLKSLITGEGGMDNSSFIRCYPNPFDQKVTVEFAGTDGHVTIEVVNTTGSLIQCIYNGNPVSGINTAVWDGTNQNGENVSAGMYYIRFISGDSVETVKISKTK
jgi:hypothetical protein